MSTDIHVFHNVFTRRECEKLQLLGLSVHHDDDSHGHGSIKKPHFLSWVASRFDTHLRLGYVDPHMKLYRLPAGAGEVEEHIDEDFVQERYEAKRSLLIHLNDDYEGGATLFGNRNAPRIRAGSAISFPHSLRHSGAKVLKGFKFVLKTDILTPIREYTA